MSELEEGLAPRKRFISSHCLCVGVCRSDVDATYREGTSEQCIMNGAELPRSVSPIVQLIVEAIFVGQY